MGVSIIFVGGGGEGREGGVGWDDRWGGWGDKMENGDG